MRYSVLIPNGRDQSYLNMCLVSVLSQSIPPSEIIIFDDTDGRNFDRAIFKMMDLQDIPCKVVRDSNIKSMFAIRERLIFEASTNSKYCLFVDDDMVLNPDVVTLMLLEFESPLSSKSKIGFVQGLRYEVGGRQMCSPDDINQVRPGTESGSHIFYGDTAILLFDREVFCKKVPWEVIRKYMDNPNMGGSDVVITMSVIDKGYCGLACPEAIGYHFADSNFSYWAGFSTADIYIQNSFKGIISDSILQRVYKNK